MRYAIRRCRDRSIRTGKNRKNNFITRLIVTYGDFIDLQGVPNPENLSQSQAALYICYFLKTLFSSYDCFKDLSYSWMRLYNEVSALQNQLDSRKVTRPLFKRTKIQHILNRASGVALASSIQSEGYLFNLYDMFRKQAIEMSHFSTLTYHDFSELFRIAAIRVKPIISDYIKSVVHDS